MSAYRVSPFRPAGWVRLGLSGALGMLFVTPMVWSVGGFGHEADAPQRAIVFLLCGAIMPLLVGFMVSWSMRGFAVRVHTEEDDDSPPHRAASPVAAKPVAHAPAAAAHSSAAHGRH